MGTVTENTNSRRLKKDLVGVVISDKMDKTVIVKTNRRVAHPIYQKVIVVSKKFSAHDETNENKIGDTVRIRQSRPLSKTKRWVVVETISKNQHVDQKVTVAATAETPTVKKASTPAKRKADAKKAKAKTSKRKS